VKSLKNFLKQIEIAKTIICMNKLLGTWKLVKHPQFLGAPEGLLCYQPNGTMFVIISGISSPPKTAEVNVIAYSGKFSFSNDTLIHHVEISNDLKKVGTDQMRYPFFEHDELILQDQRENEGAMKIHWKKIL
jgi:hypothetical protein